MINLLQLPAPLFYKSTGENGYEEYMTNDPTGVNHVLDKMYEMALNLIPDEMEETDPAYYMDRAYRLAIAIKLQKYPHRSLKMDYLNQFLEDLRTEAFYLVRYMAYVLLAFRDDNSKELKQFLKQYHSSLNEGCDFCDKTYNLLNGLATIVTMLQKEGKVFQVSLLPQPPGIAEIKKISVFFYRKVSEDAVTSYFTHVMNHNAEAQLAVLHKLRQANVFDGDFGKMADRIRYGEFLIPGHRKAAPDVEHVADADLREQLKMMASQLQINEKTIEILRKRCKCYELKQKLADEIKGAQELSKEIDVDVKSIVEEQKLINEKEKNELKDYYEQKIAELESRNERQEAMLKKDEQKIAELESRNDRLEAKLKDDEQIIKEKTDDVGRKNIVKLITEMQDNATNPEYITDEQYNGAKRLLEITMDTELVDRALDAATEKKLSKSLRKLDNTRQSRVKKLREQERFKQMAPSVNLAGAQNVTLINGNQVERNYGDTYLMENGSMVDAPKPLQMGDAPKPRLGEDATKRSSRGIHYRFLDEEKKHQ